MAAPSVGEEQAVKPIASRVRLSTAYHITWRALVKRR